MSVVHLAGGETGGLQEWSSSSWVIESGTKRTGKYSYKANTAIATSPAGIFSADTITIRGYFRTPSSPASELAVLYVFDSAPATLGTIRVDTDRKLTAEAEGGTKSAASGSALSLDTWYRIEVQYTKGSGANAKIEVKVNGSTWATSSDGSSSNAADKYRLAGIVADCLWDDVSARNDSTWPGEGQIEALRPSADSGDAGEDEWEDELGNPETFSAVNQDPLDPAEYAIESSQADADHRQLWTLAKALIYYFDDATPSDPDAVWTDDEDAFDGNASTQAYSSSGSGSRTVNELVGSGTTAPSSAPSNTGAVNHVEYRWKALNTTSGTVNLQIEYSAETLGSDSTSVTSPTWSNWATLSAPSGGWTWAKVATLDAAVWKSDGGVNAAWVYKIEILVFCETDVGTINHLRIGTQAERGAGSGTEHRIRSKVSAAENSDDLGLTTSSVYYTFDPPTQPADQSELDSYQAGVWRDDGGREFYCYEQWVMVDYTPPAGNNYTITGAVAVPTTIAATLDYTLNASLTGAVALPLTIAATLDYTLNADITGVVALPITVAASAMEFGHNYAIVGAVALPTTIAATMAYNLNASITGDVAVSTTIAATLDYTLNASIAGAVALPLTVGSTMDFTLNGSIVGAIPVPLTVAAAFDFTLNASITGAVTIPTTIAATMEYSQPGAEIVGDITVTLAVASTLDYTLNAAIAGSVVVPISVASTMLYAMNVSITGNVTVTLAIASTMEYTSGGLSAHLQHRQLQQHYLSRSIGVNWGDVRL